MIDKHQICFRNMYSVSLPVKSQVKTSAAEMSAERVDAPARVGESDLGRCQAVQRCMVLLLEGFLEGAEQNEKLGMNWETYRLEGKGGRGNH